MARGSCPSASRAAAAAYTPARRARRAAAAAAARNLAWRQLAGGRRCGRSCAGDALRARRAATAAAPALSPPPARRTAAPHPAPLHTTNSAVHNAAEAGDLELLQELLTSLIGGGRKARGGSGGEDQARPGAGAQAAPPRMPAR